MQVVGTASLCFRLFLSILRHFPMMFFKVQSWRSVDLAWVIWTGPELSASEGTGTTHLLMWWLFLSSPLLGLPSSHQKFEVCKEDCGCISKYYLKDSLLVWWEFTLRLLLWFVLINSEPEDPRLLLGWSRREQKRQCRPQGNDGLAVKAAHRQGERNNAKKPCKVFADFTDNLWHRNVKWGKLRSLLPSYLFSPVPIQLS